MAEDDKLLPAVEEAEALVPKRVKANNLLWFVGGRTYVPLPDVRRRFGLPETEGVLLRDADGALHIGLPLQAAEVLMELREKGKVDFVYDLEHAFRIVVGVFPLRLRLSSDVAVANGNDNDKLVMAGGYAGGEEGRGDRGVQQFRGNEDCGDLGHAGEVSLQGRIRERRRGRGRRRR